MAALKQYTAANEAERANMLPRLQALIESSYKDFYLPLEEEVFAKQLGLLASKSNYSLPELVAEVGGKNDNDFSAYIKAIFKLSMFTSKEGVEAYLQYPDEAILNSDPLLQLSNQLLDKYRENPESLVASRK